MNVLIGCEESQIECLAFRKRGFNAFSCDIKDCSGGHPEFHIKEDVLKVIEWGNWDFAIFHPPCTYLANSSSCRINDPGRIEKMLAAREFFLKLLFCGIKKFAIENPVPMALAKLPKYNQIIQPYYFGDPYSKKTCFWLHNVPELYATNIVKPICSWTDTSRNPVIRSKSFPGVALAMSQQWPGSNLFDWS